MSENESGSRLVSGKFKTKSLELQIMFLNDSQLFRINLNAPHTL